jgi:hypothetical protein
LGWALDTTIARAIVVGTIAILFEVSFIVLGIETHQVKHGETVMCSYKVNRRALSPAIAAKEVL